MTHSVTRPVAHGVNLYYEGYHRRYERMGNSYYMPEIREDSLERKEESSTASSPKEIPEPVKEAK